MRNSKVFLKEAKIAKLLKYTVVFYNVNKNNKHV